MTTFFGRAGRFQRALCCTLAVAAGTVPFASAFAQTNAAAMAIRARAEGLQSQGPEGSQPPQTAPGTPPGPGQPLPSEPSPGKLDTRYISPTAAVVIVARPAQLLASPLAQAFPVEVASAFAQKNLGFDATEIEEIDGFIDMSKGLNYGLTFKFKNPIRATSIPPEKRAHAQLAELGGKKYLKSAMPMMWSLYGSNNKTLVAATDVALHGLVENASQPRVGPMADRLREIPSGSDLYVAIDFAALGPAMQMMPAQAQALGKVPPEAKQALEMMGLVSGFELTLNSSAPGPTAVVVNFKDEATAQKAEVAVQEKLQKWRASSQTEQQPAGPDPIAQAMDRYQERVLQLVQPQRNGSTITFVHLDGQNPQQQQILNVLIIAAVTERVKPLVEKKWSAMMKPQPIDPGPGGVAPEGGPGGIPASGPGSVPPGSVPPGGSPPPASPQR